MSPTLADAMAKLPEAFDPGQAGDANAVIHFKFTGAEAGEWNATIRDGLCQVAQGIPRSRPDITLTADSADYLRLVTGELDPTKALMEGRLQVQGDTALAMHLVSMFHLPRA